MRPVAVACLMLVAACAQAGGAPRAAGPAPVPVVPSAEAAPTPTPAVAPHVFVIVMENKSFAEAMAQPFTARLAAENALATNYHAVAHPSLPNYLALTSGSTYGIRDDGYHALPDSGIGRQLTDAGVAWRAYMEGMTGGCLAGTGSYAVKHDPFAYYGGGCPADVVPMEPQLEADLAADPAHAPRFSWITPDLCHDGHDCTALVADAFLAALVGRITASPAFQAGGLLFVTWDEDDGGAGNQVPLIAAGAGVHPGQSHRAYDHYSLLATLEDLLGVSRLGEAASATPLDELVETAR